MTTKKKSKPTALQVFKQNMKLQDLRNKVWEAERILRIMCHEHGDDYTKLVVDSTMYEVSIRGDIYASRCEIKKIGDVSELQALLKS
jgi:hypothetical protein